MSNPRKCVSCAIGPGAVLPKNFAHRNSTFADPGHFLGNLGAIHSSRVLQKRRNRIFKAHKLRGLMEVNRVPVFDTGTRMGTSLRRAGLVPRHGVPAKPPVANTPGGSFFGALDSACQSCFKALARAFLNGVRQRWMLQNLSSRSLRHHQWSWAPDPSRNP